MRALIARPPYRETSEDPEEGEDVTSPASADPCEASSPSAETGRDDFAPLSGEGIRPPVAEEDSDDAGDLAREIAQREARVAEVLGEVGSIERLRLGCFRRQKFEHGILVAQLAALKAGGLAAIERPEVSPPAGPAARPTRPAAADPARRGLPAGTGCRPLPGPGRPRRRPPGREGIGDLPRRPVARPEAGDDRSPGSRGQSRRRPAGKPHPRGRAAQGPRSGAILLDAVGRCPEGQSGGPPRPPRAVPRVKKPARGLTAKSAPGPASKSGDPSVHPS